MEQQEKKNRGQSGLTAIMIVLLGFSVIVEFGGLQTSKATDYSYSVFYNATNATLIYPTIFDEYLWVTSCRSDNSLRKYDLATETLLQRAPLARADHSTDEAFNAYVYNGLVFVPMIGYQMTNTVLAVYNESTLGEVFHLEMPFSTTNAFTQTIYDPMHDRLLFACDMQNGSYGFWAVDPTRYSTASAYYFVNLGSDGAGLEICPVIFKDKVYAIEMDNGGGANGITTTRILSSPNLTTWTVEYAAQGYNHGTGSYFPHISANSNYMVAGLLSSAITGVTTYRYVYRSASGQWQEYNTGQAETTAEDQPMVEALDDTSLFFLEVCARFGSLNPSCYLFDASNGTAQLLYTVPDHGFNDRWFAIDQNTNTIYFGNSNRMGDYYSQILKTTFSFPLSDPIQPKQQTPSPMHLVLTTQPAQGSFSRGQSVTFTVNMFSQPLQTLEPTLTWTITGPNGYYYFDFQKINMTAKNIDEYSFGWTIPGVAGTYFLEVSLIPAQLTAYDTSLIKVT
jgi:hypothetical protein